jgi:hypothetical protein
LTPTPKRFPHGNQLVAIVDAGLVMDVMVMFERIFHPAK